MCLFVFMCVCVCALACVYMLCMCAFMCSINTVYVSPSHQIKMSNPSILPYQYSCEYSAVLFT